MPGKITLPPLPYSLDALAPVLSPRALELHYDKHHRGYVARVNKLIEGTPKAAHSLEEIIKTSTGPLAHAAAQAWNHAFFWRSLSPSKTMPAAGTISAINASFESMGAFESKLKATANELFGSGWVWLVRTKSGSLEILSTPNAGLLVHETDVVPLLTIDVWEHAYYVDYQNERARYVDGIWELLNWELVGTRMGLFASGSG